MASTASISFQPWARDSHEPNGLEDILQRVNLERGHFKDITEASLQEEIAAEGALELSDDEDEDDEDAEDEVKKISTKPTTRDELYGTKAKMLESLRLAEQEVAYSLDFVSLLLSKEAPKQATGTISDVLKQAVPLGTLGTDIWHKMPVDKIKEAEDELLATNVRMKGLQQSADDLLFAASRLQDNVKKETEYWNQVLTISEEGWKMIRIPGQGGHPPRLGVQFGFSESSRQFYRQGVAALNPSSEGTIRLERGIGSKPKALQAIFRRDRKIVGASKLPSVPDPEETKLEARIRYARDSLYDEELYYESIRESRTLASLGVGTDGSAITFKSNSGAGSDLELSLDLISLDEQQAFDPESSDHEDKLAQAVVLAARLLLSQAHRDRLKKRSEPPPPLSDKKKDDKPLLPILRPIMSFIMHQASLKSLNSRLQKLGETLDAASVQHTLQAARFAIPQNADITKAEDLISMLMQPWLSQATLKISDPNDNDLTFTFKIETTLAYNFGSVFFLSVPSRTDPYRFDNADELFTSIDTKVAAALAKALMGSLEGEWKCREREALLVKDTALNEKNQSMWIRLDSQSRVVSLISLAKRVSWEAGGESASKGLWESWPDVLEA